MIKTKKELLEYIKADRLRYSYSYISYIKGLFLCTDRSHALRLLKWLRYTEYYYNNRDKNLFFKFQYFCHMLIYSRLQYKYDTHIELNVCGPGLWMPHLGGIIINCKSMGSNCSVSKGVVMGNKSGQSNRAIIGNNCYFTLGCKIIGKVKIGDNVIVAQNSVVVKDIPNNNVVSGIPAKTIKVFESLNDINI